MELQSFNHRARTDQLLHLIVDAKADAIFLLRFIVEHFDGTTSRESLVDGLSHLLDVNTALQELVASRALRKTAQRFQVTQKGRRFVVSLDSAHDHYSRHVPASEELRGLRTMLAEVERRLAAIEAQLLQLNLTQRQARLMHARPPTAFARTTPAVDPEEIPFFQRVPQSLLDRRLS